MSNMDPTPDPAPSPSPPAQAPIRELIQPMLVGRRMRILALSGTALLSALAEAIVLVAITQIAFSLAEGGDRVDLSVGPVSIQWQVSTAIAVAFVLVVLRGCTQVLNGWQSTNLVANYQADARKEFAGAFLHSSLQEQTSQRGGELQELLTTFVGRGAAVMDTLSKGVTAVCSLVALLGTAIAVSPLAALGLIATVSLLGLTLVPLRRVIGGSSRRAANADMAFATSVNEYGGLGREMQVFGVEDRVEEQLYELIEDNARAAQRLQFLAFLFTPLYATVLLIVLVLGLASVRALGITDLAALGAVMLVMIRSLAYAQLAQGVYAALHTYAPYISDIQHRLDSLRADAVMRDGRAADVITPIMATDVSFEYVLGKAALSDVSFSFDGGEIIGIVGPSGSGKSTLVQLLLRLRHPTEGLITAAGSDISEIAMNDWRRMTAFVPQDSKLIHGTVAENIRFFRDGFSDDDLLRAAELAQISDDIASWQGGYDFHVGDAGSVLSGGQRQRLCIARAVLSRPQLLIMDEPTSALDVQSEAKIRDAVERLRGDTTVVIIAHRLSTLDICDRIMVIHSGRLRSFDTPERLRETDEFYREALVLSGIQ